MGKVDKMVDRANAVIASAPAGTDASQMADDLLELAGMYQLALEVPARTLGKLAIRIQRLETLLQLCQPYLSVAPVIERQVSNALNMVREVTQTTGCAVDGREHGE
jgi:Holliday junction resolvase